MAFIRGIVAVLALLFVYQCSVQGTTDDCILEPDPGPCEGNLKRFYYDRKAKKCKKFNYGGCEGNGNNFLTKKKCKKACGKKICQLQVDPGLCDDDVPRYFYNAESGFCELFTYGGCDGNANNFVTKEACTKLCECSAPKKVGPCKARLPRYYYNCKKEKCKKFLWGGCEPNANNFETKADCMDACD